MKVCKYCKIDLEGEKEVFSMDKLFTVHTCRENLLECTNPRCRWIGTPGEAEQPVNHPVFGMEMKIKCPKCGETDLL